MHIFPNHLTKHMSVAVVAPLATHALRLEHASALEPFDAIEHEFYLTTLAAHVVAAIAWWCQAATCIFSRHLIKPRGLQGNLPDIPWGFGSFQNLSKTRSWCRHLVALVAIRACEFGSVCRYERVHLVAFVAIDPSISFSFSLSPSCAVAPQVYIGFFFNVLHIRV